MAYRARNHKPTLVGTGLLLGMLGAGCGASTADEHGDGIDNIGEAKAALLRAQDCGDLVDKLQADAIIKVKLQAARALAQFEEIERSYGDAGVGEPIPGVSRPVDQNAGAPEGDFGDGDNGNEFPSAPPTTGSNGGAVSDSDGLSSGESAGGDESEGPTGASNTNTQVEGVDEADFVKVVKMGESMFVLNGSTLYKVKTWPAAETSLSGGKVVIEGSASEMFVTDSGKAVVFSTVNGYGDSKTGGGTHPVGDSDVAPVPLAAADIACVAPAIEPGIAVDGLAYRGCGGYYQPFTKITVVDVSGAEFKTERELYYEGNYVSSRRYDDVVRVVLQAQANYQFLQVDYYDPKTYQPLSRREFEAKLRERVRAAEGAIRKLDSEQDWLPSIREAKQDKLVDLAPNCGNFYVPVAGLSDYGLTHVLSLDLAHGNEVGGVTIMGSAQTVYSNLDSLVLAQPDYRWGPAVDFGFVDEQQLNVHLFSIHGAETNYQASGSVSGMLPPHNPQFGIDVEGSVLRLATTGRKRANPTADQQSPDFWRTNTTNQVYTLEQKGKLLAVLGKSENLGHEGESVQSARFVGNRAYVVTFEQTDPLVVLDVKDPTKLTVLGQIEIPGFSQYMHPLDENHLITIGQSGNWGVQLQLFDVTDPAKLIPPPKVLDFGQGSSSEGQYNHKALTYFAEQNLLAMPLYSYGNGYSSNFSSTLQLIKVDAVNGFEQVGEVDHSELYQTQTDGCVKCYEGYCQYACYNYQPEVRRGHFVTSDEATYVYSFSYAGVIVNDLANLNENLAAISLPAPTYDGQSWYGNLGGGDESASSAGTTTPQGNAGVDSAGTASSTPRDGGVATPEG